MTSTTNHGPRSGPGTDGAAPGGWSAVVYGRTLQVDQWWRALPAGVARQGPAGDAVRAAVAGGNRLEHGPRFLLHRDEGGVLVGAACELGLISREMVHDRFGRALYGFVGWYRPASLDGGGRIPELAELAEHLADWAGPVYAEWIAPTWEAVDRVEAEPLTTRPVAAPWPERTPEQAVGAAGPEPLPPAWRPVHPQGSHLLPEAVAPGLWTAAAAGRDRCVLVTGWRRRSDAETGRITHLTSTDCHGYELLLPPPPPPPPPPPAPPRPGTVPGQGPEPGPGPKPGGTPGGKSGGKPGARSGAAQPGTKPGPRPGARTGPSAWGRAARGLGEGLGKGLGKLRREVADAFWSEDPAQQEAGGNAPERQEPAPKHPGDGPRFGQGPGRDPYDGLGTPPAQDTFRTGAPGTGAPGAAAPGAAPLRPGPAERPRWRTRAVDPQQADFTGMFGEFDDEPAPPTGAAPGHPPKSPSTDPGDRTASDTGEPS
ncbi:hypothetical protein [Kitasatospora sp. NPDC001527]|uniref:hypothetical protein n=1 Tax=Kitasatospora sp. NPDC001527 TaxID=3154519 RepID=UPI003325625E